jgi:predicted DNA-binding protein (MmcQ/YjbR family)
MDIDAFREYCLGFPHATEQMQWGATLCLKVGGKLFAVASLDSSPVRASFKCSPENFLELCEREGVSPAPYLARAQWVAVDHLGVMTDRELRELLAEAHRLIWKSLPKGKRAEMEGLSKPKPKPNTKAKARPKTNRKSNPKTRGEVSMKRQPGSISRAKVGGSRAARKGK